MQKHQDRLFHTFGRENKNLLTILNQTEPDLVDTQLFSLESDDTSGLQSGQDSMNLRI